MNKKFLLLACIFLGVFSVSSFSKGLSDSPSSRGNLTTKEFEVPDSFTGIINSTSYDLTILVGDDFAISGYGNEQAYKILNLQVIDGILQISNSVSPGLSNTILDLEIRLPDLESMINSTSADVLIEGSMESLVLTVSGSGDIEMKGGTDLLKAELNGSGRIDGKNFITATALIHSSGSGDVTIFVSEKLDALLTGSGDLDYYGKPEDARYKVEGSGKVTEK